MLYCPNFFWNVLQVWMTGKDVYLQMTWSWSDKTWNILCSYCLQWNTSQSKFRNHYFLFLFAFSILSQLFLIWGCTILVTKCVPCTLYVDPPVRVKTEVYFGLKCATNRKWTKGKWCESIFRKALPLEVGWMSVLLKCYKYIQSNFKKNKFSLSRHLLMCVAWGD